MGYVEHWLLTASSAIGILALMLIVRWREKRKKRMSPEPPLANR